MLRVLMLINIITLVGCLAPGECKEGSKGFMALGLCVVDNGLGITEEEVDTVITYTEEETKKLYPQVIDLPSKLWQIKARVEFLDDDLAVHCKKIDGKVYTCEDVGGVTMDEYKMYVEYRKCIANSSLGHELLHLIQLHYLHIKDPKHDTAGMFELANPENPQNTIEFNIRKQTILSLDTCNDFKRYYQD